MSNNSSIVREKGEHRLELMRSAKTQEEWYAIGRIPRPSFPFAWTEWWKQCTEYRVSDLASEMGFLIDLLGFIPFASDPEFAMVTSPDQSFFVAIRQATVDAPAIVPNSLVLEFMVADINGVIAELEGRGVEFEEEAKPSMEGSPMYIAHFRTPNGVRIRLWGMTQMPDAVPAETAPEGETAS